MNSLSKNDEFKYRFADFTIERAGDAIFWHGGDAKFKRVNEAACKLLGYSREELLSLTVFDIDPNITEQSFAKYWTELKKANTLHLEAENRNKAGQIIPVEVTLNFLEFEGQEYSCSFVRDITERKQNEEVLREAQAENARFESELKMATLVQEGFLPASLPDHPNFRFAVKMTPARYVGGDFYDFIPLDENRLGILLGDVSGKGVSAALYMAQLLSDFRYHAQHSPKPGMIFSEINQLLYRRSQRGMFATALLLLIHLNERTMFVANAGHPPMLVRNPTGAVREIGTSANIPLGILPDKYYESEEITLEVDEMAMLFTDGAFEPCDRDKLPFGIKRLQNALSKAQGSPDDLISGLQKAIDDFTQGALPHDDLTLLAFQATKR